MSSNTGERKVITIRGVDQTVYERALKLARELGMTVGELVNEALRRFITTLENTRRMVEAHLEALAKTGDVIIISGVDSMTVSRKDLEAIDKKVVFKDIKELIFADDITDDIFKEKVYEIVNVDKVVVPKSLSTLLVASKCKYTHKIVSKE